MNIQQQKTYQMYLSKANSGDAEAQYQLGLMELHEHEISRASALAMEHAVLAHNTSRLDIKLRGPKHWFELAATDGHIKAAVKLGYMYEKGIGGVEKNKEMARKWYHKAAARHDEEAIRNLASLNAPSLWDRFLTVISAPAVTSTQQPQLTTENHSLN